MHSDYLNVSFPDYREHEIRRLLGQSMGYVGAIRCTDDLYKLGHASAKLREGYGWLNLSLSGQMLGALRDHAVLPTMLSDVAMGAHRVTKLDVAHDLHTDAPKLLKRLKRRSEGGNMRLTRKYLRPQAITWFESYCHYRPGTPTGTLYLGNRTAEVRARVYDKRNERIDRGFDDPGSLTRFELTVTGKVGVSLRDVVSPMSLYWNFMSDVLPPPSNVPLWEPAGEGYSLDRDAPPDFVPFEVLRRKIATSPEVDELLSLAEQMGPNGYAVLLRLLDAKRTAQVVPDQPSCLVANS